MTSCIAVDDEQELLEVFCEILELINIKVLGKGRNGKDAVSLYKKHKPDIVFLDMSMPKFDGVYAAKNIKEYDNNAKIIIVTGDLNADESYLLESLGVTSVIYKPFDISKLKESIVQKILE